MEWTPWVVKVLASFRLWPVTVIDSLYNGIFALQCRIKFLFLCGFCSMHVFYDMGLPVPRPTFLLSQTGLGQSLAETVLIFSIWNMKIPPYIAASHIYIFFLNPLPLTTFFWQYCPNDVRGKHKNRLMGESYFFMFRVLQNNVSLFLGLQNNVTLVFFISNTFISHIGLRFDSKW